MTDTPYCNVNRDKIISSDPILDETNFRHFYKYITERYLIKKRKDRNEPLPWTSDPILKEYRFTNVRREQDFESRWLIKNIINHPKASYEDKLLNIVLFRLYNKHQTAELLKMPIPLTFLNFNITKYKSRLLKAPTNFTHFTNAFLTSGMKQGLKHYIPKHEEFVPAYPLHFIKFLTQDNFTTKIKEAKNQKDVFDIITSYKGIGPFLGYQIFVDFTYIPEFPFTEDEFVVSGPGCTAGLKFLFNDRGGLSWDELIFWLKDNIDTEFTDRGYDWNPHELFDDIPEEHRYMSIMSIENCLCEISKYIRATNGTGRPRARYKRRSQ